jgi:sterol 3beta-glucosyltransferase
MRITILTFGSRGDVQPYLALGVGLQAAGHEVCLAAPAPFAEFVQGYGLQFMPIAGNPTAQHADPQWQTYHTQKSILSYIYHGTVRFFLPLLPALFYDCWQACQGAEAIISTPSAGVAGFHIAEKLGVPFYQAWTNPGVKTHAFPHPYMAPRMRWLQKIWGDRFNTFSYDLINFLFSKPLTKTIAQLRQDFLELPPMSAATGDRWQQVPILYAYSPAVIPKPADWSDSVHVTGYWFLDRPSHWQPNPDLVRFIAEGDPPLYIGFGSIIEQNPIAITQLIIEAVLKSGQRAVLDAGWANLGDLQLPPQIHRIQSADAPHEWLFPQMSAVIHHGGAGTTGAGLRAGKPTVVIYSLVTDYYFWGQCITTLKVGVPPIFRKHLSVTNLVQAIDTVLNDPEMQQRAAALGKKLRAEQGVKNAIAAFHRHLPAAKALPVSSRGNH